MYSVFPYFIQFKFEFFNKDIMIWATVSSRSCFCWLYRAFPSLVTKNIVNLILIFTDHLVMSMYKIVPIVGRGCLLWPVPSGGKTVSFCPTPFCTKGQTCLLLQVISWLSTFAFPFPMIKKISVFGVNSKRSCYFS